MIKIIKFITVNIYFNHYNLFNFLLKQSLSKTNYIIIYRNVFFIILRRFGMSIDSSGKDVSIVLCGEAGQGIQTVETILVKAIKKVDIMFFQPRNICPGLEEVKTPQRLGYHQIG